MTQTSATAPCEDRPPYPLLSRLLESGFRFSFFQAVNLLERVDGDWEPVGHQGPANRELLKFRPHPGIEFPATDVRRIMRLEDATGGETVYGVDVAFLGLYGVSTPLPLHYAVEILRSVDIADRSEKTDLGPRPEVPSAQPEPEYGFSPTRDFLDILNHRLISFFYRSWTKYRYHTTFGQPLRDSITAYLLWLIGLSPDCSEATLGVDPIRMIRSAGLLTQHPHSAANLEGFLRDYWVDLPIEVQECIGRWVALSPEDINAIGRSHSRLGIDLTVGEAVYDVSGAFNVVIGPTDWTTYASFLPDTRHFAETRSLVRLYRHDPMAFTIEVSLKPDEVPAMRVGSDATSGRLGYTSWIHAVPSPATSVVFEVAA